MGNAKSRDDPYRLCDGEALLWRKVLLRNDTSASEMHVVASSICEISLPNVKCGGTAAQDSQSKANEGACSPLPPTTCSALEVSLLVVDRNVFRLGITIKSVTPLLQVLKVQAAL